MPTEANGSQICMTVKSPAFCLPAHTVCRCYTAITNCVIPHRVGTIHSSFRKLGCEKYGPLDIAVVTRILDAKIRVTQFIFISNVIYSIAIAWFHISVFVIYILSKNTKLGRFICIWRLHGRFLTVTSVDMICYEADTEIKSTLYLTDVHSIIKVIMEGEIRDKYI